MELLQSSEASLVVGWKEWRLPKQEAEFQDLPHLGYPLMLQCDDNHRLCKSAHHNSTTGAQTINQQRKCSHSWTRSNFFRVCGTFCSRGEILFVPEFYARWNLCPSFWTGDKKHPIIWRHPQSPQEEKSYKSLRQEVMVTLYRDHEVVILVRAMPEGGTTTAFTSGR